MKKKWKGALWDAFEPPEPKRKEAFLRSMPQPGISNLSFVISQMGYIRKHVWVISAAVFGTAFVGACVLGRDVMWVISALLPFAAESLVSEYNRSQVYLMSELEMAARFSLKSVVLARMEILGVTHLALLLFLLPTCAWFHTASLFQTGLYLLVPYLLTADAGLWALRKIRGTESVYACMGIAVSISAMELLVQKLFPALFGLRYVPAWILLLAAAAVCGIKEWKWNFNSLSELFCI